MRPKLKVLVNVLQYTPRVNNATRCGHSYQKRVQKKWNKLSLKGHNPDFYSIKTIRLVSFPAGVYHALMTVTKKDL